MSYPQVSIDNAGSELDRLHREIEGKLRSTTAFPATAMDILAAIEAAAPAALISSCEIDFNGRIRLLIIPDPDTYARDAVPPRGAA